MHLRSTTLAIALVAFGAPATSRAATPPVQAVAVFPIEDTSGKIDPPALATLGDYFATRIGEIPGFSIVPSSEVRARIDLQKAESYKACYDEACQIEIGKEVAASKGVSTRIAAFGEGCILSSYVYDLARASTDATASLRAGCDPGSMLTALDQLAKHFRDLLAPAKTDAAFGSAFVGSKPAGGEIVLDRVPTRLFAPAMLRSVAPGKHQIAVETDEERGEVEIEIAPAKTSSVEVQLSPRPSRLAIDTHPEGATIFIEGKEVGRSPLTIEVHPGLLEITATAATGETGKASVLAKPARAAKEVSLMLVRTTAPVVEVPESHSPRIGWLVTTGLFVAGGVVLDNVPPSAHDHRLGPLDLAPAGLYALGLITAAIGIWPVF